MHLEYFASCNVTRRTILLPMKVRLFIFLCLLTALGMFPPRGSAVETDGGALENANQRLGKLQSDLHLSQDARRRVQARLAVLEAQDNPDPEIVRLYRLALKRLEALEQETLAAVEALERAGATAPPPAAPVLPEDFKTDPFAGIVLPKTEELDAALQLNSELDRALAEFDKDLLNAGVEVEDEIASIPEKANSGGGSTANQGASGGGAGAEGAGAEAMAQGTDAAGGASGGSAGQQAGEAADAKTGENGAGEVAGVPKVGAGAEPTGDTRTGTPGSPTTDSSGKGSMPSVAQGGNQTGAATGTRGSGGGPRTGAEDDDIVARQLREAAEAETDPVLKEKLWKEYEAYKNAGR